LASLPDECWLKVFTHLEAVELSGCAALLSTGALALSNQVQLWVSLLHMDFAASFAQRSLLWTWLEMHQHFHPRQLYIYKRREHRLDLDVARTELQLRGEQAREQDRKQRRLRMLNFFFVRIAHLLLFGALLSSSVLLWLRLDGKAKWSFYVIFAPIFAFEIFVFVSAIIAFTIYFQRGSSGWTFYWNRLRGIVRWLILYTSPGEGIVVMVLGSSIVPLMACTLEGDCRLPAQYPRYTLPFVTFWLASLCFVCSLVRRRTFSAGCVGSFVLVWVPIVSLSVLIFLRLSIFPDLSPYIIFAPSLMIAVLVLLFVGFLVVASFWLGYRGNQDWTEYATVTLLTMLTLLLPLLLFQLAILGYLDGHVSTDFVFLPWVSWLSCLVVCAIWHIFMPLVVAPSVAPIDHITRSWRQPHDRDMHSDDDHMALLPPTGTV
jgi:hypothetical protein